MEEIEKLYGVVSKEGLYTKSLDEFKTRYSDESSREKLYDVVSQKGLYTKTKEEFNTKYFSEVKKKDDSQPVGEAPQKVSSTQPPIRKFLLDGGNPKKPLVSEFLSGGKSEKDILRKQNEATLGLTKKPSSSLSVPKPKGSTTIEEINKGNQAFKQVVTENLSKYRENTKLSDGDKKDSEQQLLDKKNTKGIVNNAIDLFHKATNYFSTGVMYSSDPLKDEKQQARDYFAQQKIKASSLDIDKKADEIFLENKNTEKKQQKINSFLGDLDPQKKTYLEVDAENRFKSIDKDRNDITNRMSLNSKYLDTLLDDIKDPNISPEQKEYKQSEVQKISGYLKTDYDKYTSFKLDSKKLGDVQDEFDAFRRNYNFIDNAGGRIKSAMVSIGADLVAATGYVAQYTDPTFGALKNMQAQEYAFKLKETSNAIRESLRPDNKEVTWGNFVQTGLDTMFNTAPVLAVGAATGGGAATLLGLGKLGETYNEMYEKQKEGKANYSPDQMAFAPLVSGTSNALLWELPMFYNLRAAKNVFQAGMRSEASSILMENSFKETGKKIAGDLFKSAGIQIPTAAADQIVQNSIKRDILGDTTVQYTDGVSSTIKSAAFLSGMMSVAPHVALGIVKKFSNTSDNAILDRNGIKIKEYLEKLDDVNIDEKTKEIFKKSIDKMTKQSSEIVNKNIQSIGNISDSNIDKVSSNNKRIEEIKIEAEQIKSSEHLTDEQKLFELNGLKSETIGILKENNTVIEEASKQGTRRKGKLGEEEAAVNPEGNTFFYYEAKGESKPTEVPEGYTNTKKVENSEEVKLWEKQNPSEAKPKGTQDEISQPTETTTSEKEAEVKRLRAEEQNEYKDVDPTDKVKLGEIYNRYDKLISPLLREIEGEAKPTEVEVKPKEELFNVSDEELESRYNDLDEKGFKKFTEEERKEFNDIEKEQEKREWQSVVHTDEKTAIENLNNLKSKETRFIEKRDIRESLDIIEKYKNSKKISNSEVKKDFDDALSGNPTTWYADALKLKYATQEYINRGGSIKELTDFAESKFISDGYDIETAKEVVASKIEPILKNFRNEGIEINPTEVKSKPLEIDGAKPTEVKAEEPTLPKTRSRRKTKEAPTEEFKAEEVKEKEDVSLPKVIDDTNFEDVVKKLMDSDKVTKPCE